MADTLFDIRFAGELLEGADPFRARSRIQELFKLSDAAAERLFGGSPVTIKRGVDAATVTRFREVFRAAGARVSVVPAGIDRPRESGGGAPDTAADGAGQSPRLSASAESSPLELAAAGQSLPLESPPPVPAPEIDTSHLNLVEGDDWTLEDCAPSRPPVAEPDISHLTLAPPEEGTEH
jgi:hypothetical protein